MQEQLSQIVNGFETARMRLHRIAAKTPIEKFSTRNSDNSWSVAECVAHLNLTSRAYVALLNDAFAKSPKLSMAPTHYKHDTIGWLIGKLVGPRPRIGSFKLGKMPTAPTFMPTGDEPREKLLTDFESLQDEQVALAKGAEGRALERIQIVSPFNAHMKYNAYSCLVLLPRHQHRHLEQAESVWW